MWLRLYVTYDFSFALPPTAVYCYTVVSSHAHQVHINSLHVHTRSLEGAAARALDGRTGAADGSGRAEGEAATLGEP